MINGILDFFKVSKVLDIFFLVITLTFATIVTKHSL